MRFTLRRLTRLPLGLTAGTGLVVAGIYAAVLVGFTPAHAGIAWRGDYESGNLSQWNLGVQQASSGRVTIVNSPLRQGRYAARFEVDPGDDNVAGSGSGERAEVLTGNAINQTSSHEDWLAWSTMFAPNFQPTANTAWNHFIQFHPEGGGMQSSAFQLYQNTMRLIIWGGTLSSPVSRVFTFDSNRQNGVWYDFVLHVKWSNDPSVGFVELWENGKKVIPLTHLSTLYSGLDVYLKEGYYRAASSSVAVLYQDGMRRGDSYQDVVADFPSGTWSGSSDSTTTSTSSSPTTQQTSTTTATTSAAIAASSSISNGDTLRGTVPWSVTTSSPAGSVQFFVLNQPVGNRVSGSTSFTYSLDTTKYADGDYHGGFWVYDSAGNVVYKSPSYYFTIANGSGATTTTTSGGATTTTSTTTTTSSTTTTTTTSSSGNKQKPPSPPGKARGNGQPQVSRTGSDPEAGTRALTAVGVSRTARRPSDRYVRVVSALVSAHNVRSLRISAISSRGKHLRMPLLAGSRVDSLTIGYWRKTIVTGAVRDGRIVLRLRVPRARLHHGAQYALRVRALGPAGLKTTYLRFSFK